MLGRFRKDFAAISDLLASRLNTNPNYITLSSLGVAAFACYALYLGFVEVAGLLVALNGFLDWLDGAVARFHKRVTLRGELLDAVIDKYSECFILLALVFIGIPLWLSSFACIGVLMTTYVQARLGEALGKKRPLEGIGLERSDRCVLLTIGLLFNNLHPFLLPSIVAILAIGSNLTAALRLSKALKFLGQTG